MISLRGFELVRARGGGLWLLAVVMFGRFPRADPRRKRTGYGPPDRPEGQFCVQRIAEAGVGVEWAEAATQKRKLYFCHEIPSGKKEPTSSGCAIQLTFSREGVPCFSKYAAFQTLPHRLRPHATDYDRIRMRTPEF